MVPGGPARAARTRTGQRRRPADADPHRPRRALHGARLHAGQRDQLAEADDGVQFSHTLDEQIRGQIQAGLRIVDLYEDTNGYGRLHELGIPSFWATLAQKPED